MAFWNRKKEEPTPQASQPNPDAPILILGSGCSKCHQLEQVTKEALEALGRDEALGHVTDPVDIAKYGVMSTPGLVVHNKLVSQGKVLSLEAVKDLLENHL